jgi:hypothetical protein
MARKDKTQLKIEGIIGELIHELKKAEVEKGDAEMKIRELQSKISILEESIIATQDGASK